MKDFSLVLLRVSLGILMLWAGTEKILQGFSAAGYLTHLKGALASYFQVFAGNATTDNLVMWGLTLGGIALIIGAGTRVAMIGLSLMMALFYLSQFPAANGWVDDHVIFIAVMILLWAYRSSEVWGFGKWLRRLPLGYLLV